MHRVTADSNIYISALLFGGKPLTLLEMAQEGQIELAVSDDSSPKRLASFATSSSEHLSNSHRTKRPSWP